MATNTAISLKFLDHNAIKSRLGTRFAFLVACSITVGVLSSQEVVAAEPDSASAPILNSDTANSDNGNAAAQQAGNRKWTFTPSLGLEETYTDNVFLAPQGSEKSAWVTQINPGLSLSGAGPNLKANATYQLQNLFYSGIDRGKTTYQQLNANANAKLINDFLFVDGMADINQQNISPLGTLAIDNTNITNNRTNIRTYSISPYLKHRFSDNASGELRYTHDEVDTDAGSLAMANSQADNILLNLNSDTAADALGWGINYNKQHMNYKGSNQTSAADSEMFSGTLRRLVTPYLTLNATGGYEKYNYLSGAQQLQGASLTAGFSWAPSARTDIEASAGHRFFGPTYSLKASHRAHRTAWNVDYSEDITTPQSQFLTPATIDTSTFLDNLWASSIPDPALRQQTVNDFIGSNGLPDSLGQPINYLNNQLFLQKLLQAAVAITGTTNTLLFSIFDMSRTALASETSGSTVLGTNDLGSNANLREIGGNALWNWRLSSRTNANISANASGTGGGNYLESLNASISRQLQPNLSGSITLRRTEQHADQIGIGYHESAITALLLKKF
ncbi:MAG: TIGR03016 family PEP-CTERM system-associated outer membrane protein [Gallionellaceae bacterium]